MDRELKKKIQFFQETILKWYEENNRKYYWRKPNLSNYQYVIAEVLLQRTKADTVAAFYHYFIKQFPNWNSLANSDLETIAEALKPIGLYTQRAKRLHSLATEMVKRRGRLPRKREDLESIPFMGQYISNAVQLIIHEEEIPLIDVNMARVLERFFEPRKLADIRYDPGLQDLAFKVVRHEKSKEISWAILDFAALVCKAKSPLHSKCPLSSICNHYNSPTL